MVGTKVGEFDEGDIEGRAMAVGKVVGKNWVGTIVGFRTELFVGGEVISMQAWRVRNFIKYSHGAFSSTSNGSYSTVWSQMKLMSMRRF